ncbi:lipopolysaccharide biosynthesis protein [Piscinibacter terrae]|nr:lipopolysaccharide biosynthesis protein [Albitalea terrae]
MSPSPEPSHKTSLLRRIGSAWLNVVAKLGGTALSFGVYIALARWMSPEAFAEVVVMLTWLAIATAFGGLSMPLVVVRHVAENLAAGQVGVARGTYRFALAAIVAVSLSLGGLAVVLAALGWLGSTPGRFMSVTITAALLVPSVVLTVQTGLLQALKQVVLAELLTNTVRPILLLIGLGGLWLATRSPLAASTVLAAYLLTALLLVTALWWKARQALPAAWRITSPEDNRRAAMHTAMGFMLVMIAAALNERVDMLLLGATGRPEDIGAYAVATRFGQAIIVAVNAVSAVMAPHFVEQLQAIKDGRTAAAQDLVSRTARTTLWLCLLALVFFALLGPWLAALFGPHYGHAYLPLVVLAGGQALAALFGPAALACTLAGSPRVAVASLLAGIATNAVLNLVLVPRFGATGAAAATACGTVLAAGLSWLRTRQMLGIDSSVLASRQSAVITSAAS